MLTVSGGVVGQFGQRLGWPVRGALVALGLACLPFGAAGGMLHLAAAGASVLALGTLVLVARRAPRALGDQR